MKSVFRIAVALALTVSVAGCGSSLITGGPLLRPGEPTGVIEVFNQTGAQLHAVLISDCNASTYGLNRLPRGMAIPSGGSYRFEVSAGCWDVDAGTMGVGEARQRMTVDAGGVTRYTVH
jgi:hypothetical protein